MAFRIVDSVEDLATGLRLIEWVTVRKLRVTRLQKLPAKQLIAMSMRLNQISYEHQVLNSMGFNGRVPLGRLSVGEGLRIITVVGAGLRPPCSVKG